jgi:hypothetical protein
MIEPTDVATAFNCTLTHRHVSVTSDRIAEFYSEPRSSASQEGFLAYCARVESNNP